MTSPLDSGPGSLAQAILDANANPGADQITFGVSSVAVTYQLPVITGVTAIDGTLAGGGRVTIQGNLIDCSRAFQFSSGSSGSSLTHVIVNGFCESVRVDSGVSAVTATASTLGGVVFISGSDNVFRGNVLAVVQIIDGDRNQLLGNQIRGELLLLFADSNRIGSVIEGNMIDQIRVQSSAGSIIEGNLISHGPGPAAFPGVSVSNANPPAAAGTTIRGNGIRGYMSGVAVLSANSTAVTITGNAIFNVGIPIDLGADGPTSNDPAPDSDTGANNLQNFPVLTSAVRSPTQFLVNGTLSSAPLTTYRVELFSSPASDAEARAFLGGFNVTTDGAGNATFANSSTVLPAFGDVLTSTATNVTTGDTSEVSAPIAIETVGSVPALSPFALLALALCLAVVAAHFVVRM